MSSYNQENEYEQYGISRRDAAQLASLQDQIASQAEQKAVETATGFGIAAIVVLLVLIIGGITAVVFAGIGMKREYKYGTWGTKRFGNGTGSLTKWDNPIFFMLLVLLILSFFPGCTALAWIVFGIYCFYKNAPAVLDAKKQ